MRTITIVGGYLEDINRYYAEYTINNGDLLIRTSKVYGYTPHLESESLSLRMGYIKALEHALGWVSSNNISKVTVICDRLDLLEPLFDRKLSNYPEIVSARKYVKDISKHVKINYISGV